MKQGVSSPELGSLKVMCPYCYVEQKVDMRSVEINLAYCDSEEGGCEKTFYLKATIQYRWKALKIEEEEA